MKTAKVTEVLDVKEWNGPNGTVFYHKIRLDNGDAGTIGKKTSGSVKAGDTLNYEITETEHGNKIKTVQDNNFGGKGFRASNASFALSYAKDLMVAQIAAGKTADLLTPAIIDATLIAAGRFQSWLKEHE